MYKLDKLFRTAFKYGASDLYVFTGIKPVLRIHGELITIKEHPVLAGEQVQEYIYEFLSDQQKKTLEKTKDLDLSLEIGDIGRFRVNVFFERRGICAAFRLIPDEVRSLDDLKLPDQLKNITEFPHGLVITTGPTGSGKSTTLAAIINEFNAYKNKHIVTIEDPIEFVHKNKKSIIQQREIGSHTQSFTKALRAALREDINVLLVGEMRDLETISLAITAAETGHLVLGSLHTAGAAKSIDRIIDVFPKEQQSQIRAQISETLRCVIWQQLLKTSDKKGRVASLEILFNNNAIANMIRKEKTYQIDSAIETGKKEGMVTMKSSLMDLIEKGKVTMEEAAKFIPQEFEEEENE